MAEEAKKTIVETPEFKAAVAAEVKAAVSEVLLSMRHDAATLPENAIFTRLFEQMGLTIAQIADQGTNRKRVAPEVLAARAAAQEKMGKLIEASRILPKEERPLYRLVAKVYLKEQIIDPMTQTGDKRMVPTRIVWTGAPNEAMRPINDSAKAIYQEFVKSIGGTAEMRAAPPAWMTNSGLVIVGAGPTTAGAHGMAIGPIPLDEDIVPDTGNGASGDENELAVLDQNDPRAPEIHVLGTIAPPATRMVPGQKVA